MMTREQLMTCNVEVLFKELNRAYTRQAYVVDNGGSDDESYAAERRCGLIESVVKERGLDDEYDQWCQP